MNEMTQSPIKGSEHWTTKDGGVKLFLFEKCAGDPAKSIGTILFVHGSSMACAADLRSAGAGAAGFLGHGSLRPPRLRLLVRRHGGLWPLDQGPRQQRADLARRRRLLCRRALYPEAARQAAAPRLRHFLRRAARGDVCRAPSRRWWRGWRSTPWCGPAKARPRSSSAARSCLSSWPRTAGRSTRPSSIRSSSATIPAPPRRK